MKYSKLLLASSILIIAFSCTKIITTELGSDLIPPIDGITTKDTFLTVETRNLGIDTLAVGKSDFHSVGITNDPLFGKTDARIALELKPLVYPYSFEVTKDSLYLDSVVLVLSYSGTWGDTTQNVNLQAEEISRSTPFKVDSLYRSIDNISTTAVLGAGSFDPKRLYDSVKVYKDTTAAQIRIKLNNSLGRRLLDFDSLGAYRSDSAFKANFAGIVIKATSGNALFRISLVNTNTKLALYYNYKKRGTPTTEFDTTVRYFSFNVNTCASANTIGRDRAGSQAQSYLANSSPTQDLLFLQAGPGITSTIKIPGLANFPNAVIHRAELQIRQVPDNAVLDGFFFAPALFLGASNSKTDNFAFSDDIQLQQAGVANLASYGSLPTTVKHNGNDIVAYNFNVSRYVQGVVTKKNPTYTFKLFAPYNQYISTDSTGSFFVRMANAPINNAGIGRVRLGGGNNTTLPMRLRIIYSIL